MDDSSCQPNRSILLESKSILRSSDAEKQSSPRSSHFAGKYFKEASVMQFVGSELGGIDTFDLLLDRISHTSLG